MKSVYPVFTLIVFILWVPANSYAQTLIDVTDQHAKIGRTFVDKVWISTKTGTVTLPKQIDLPTGANGDQIKIKYRDPISRWSFRSAVNEVVNIYSDITNAMGGWTDEDKTVMTLISLSSGDNQNKQRADCLVAYDEKTGIAVFILTSTQL